MNKVKKLCFYSSSFLPNHLGKRHDFTVTRPEAQSSPHAGRLNWETMDYEIRKIFYLETCLIFPKKLNYGVAPGLLGLFSSYVVIFCLICVCIYRLEYV